MKTFVPLTLVPFLLAACATNTLPTPPMIVATTTPSPLLLIAPATGSFTPSPIPLPTTTLTVSPEPALAPNCKIADEQGQLFLLSDLEFRSLFTSDGDLERALATHYPDWANYTQMVSWDTQPVRLGEIIVSASLDVEANLQINAAVTLVTLGDNLQWQLPSNTDLYLKSQAISTELDRLSFDWDNESLRSQYPEVANAGTYALYAFLNYNLDRLQSWCNTYQQLFGPLQ